MLANQLRESILRGEISEGDLLPPERELVSQTGMSRGAVREALRMLAVEGLLKTKAGRFGGNIVTLPGKATLETAVNQFVRGRRVSLRTVQEAREALEPGLARLAAVRRTDSDLKDLKTRHEELVASADDFHSFSKANIRWHKAVAKAGNNELLGVFLDSMLYGVSLATTTQIYDPETRAEVIRVHNLINEAIEAGDADLAEKRMRQHIKASVARAAAPATTPIALSDEEGED